MTETPATDDIYSCFDTERLLAHQTRVREGLEDAFADPDIEAAFFRQMGTEAEAVDNVARVRDLRPIGVHQLELGVTQHDCQLEGTLAAFPVKLKTKQLLNIYPGVTLVLQDLKLPTSAVKVNVYKMLPPGATQAQINQLFPIGAKVAIMEPHLKAFSDGTTAVYIDSPNDFAVLEMPPDCAANDVAAGHDAAALREKGNALFRAGRFTEALEYYTSILEMQPDNGAVWSNAAAAYVALERWDDAYLAARRSHELDPTNMKAAYRRGLALLKLRCYAGAVPVLEAATGLSGDKKQVMYALKEARFLAEQAAGNYSSDQLYPSGCRMPHLADYLGPVELFASPLGGRGLRITRPVEAGELLIVESAVGCIIVPSDTENTSALRIAELQEVGPEKQLEQEVFNRADASRLDRARLVALDAANSPKSEGTAPAHVDTQTFAPFTSEEELYQRLKATDSTAVKTFSMDRVRSVIKRFVFNGDEVTSQQLPRDPILVDSDRACGCMWPLLSLINHGCAPNVCVVPANATVVVRASRTMEAGEELLMAFIPLSLPVTARRNKLKSDFGLHCECARCKTEEALPRLVGDTVTHLHELTCEGSSLNTEYREARRKTDIMKFQELWGPLQKQIVVMERALKLVGVEGQALAWCRASAFEAFRMEETLALGVEHLSNRVLAFMERNIGIEAATAPGSVTHVGMAAILSNLVVPEVTKELQRTKKQPVGAATAAASHANGGGGRGAAEVGPPGSSSVPIVSMEQAKRLMTAAVKARYGKDLTRKQVEELGKRALDGALAGAGRTGKVRHSER